ncbi:MAG: alpha-glucan family phosphorylase [Anaerolineae bacterium]|nr:alpha-glucan family phosphorylase [Anaerolineae bacterium]
MLRPYRTFTVTPSLPPQLRPLRDLAYNLWWTWNLDAVDLFRRLDRDLWEEADHNPVLMLGKVAQARLNDSAHDDGFVAQMMRVYQNFNHYMSRNDTWFQIHYPDLMNHQIAYFSAEFGLTECMAMYSGGLGVLAGDHLKAASDMGLPMVGVSLLYQQGYFRQYLNADGWQQESYPLLDLYNLPIQLEHDSLGKPVTVGVAFPGREIMAQVWRAQVGRTPIYFLDTNIPANRPEDRNITGQLYGGDEELRIQQELVLGVGGLRALSALGIDPTVCHMNDGHPAFLALERIRRTMRERGFSFEEALELTSAGNVFTTHTPVPAGIDRFSTYLLDRYLSNYYDELELGREGFLALGRPINASFGDVFSMAVLALRLSSTANGVSEFHGQVARAMWRDLWPGTPAQEVPITSVTNGVHMASWMSHDMVNLLLRYLGPRWAERPEDLDLWERADRIPDEELWRSHERRRERLVAVARDRLARQFERRGETPRGLAEATEVLNPEALTIGFARRFATYKRALLLFRDPDRLSRILNDPDMPVQILYAGKAHPRDNPGKEFIRQIVHLTRREDIRRHVIFLEDYDMSLARYLVQGVDVWLNTPRVGLEASGTSGMKAAGNGVLNLSTLDGWWREGYSPSVGWRIGSGESYEDDAYGDEIEAQALYDLLEKDVIPLFYRRGSDGLPREWIAKMKGAIRQIAPYFNTHRMVQEYAERIYVPATTRYTRLQADDAHEGRDLAAWLQRVRKYWGQVRIVDVEGSLNEGGSVGDEVRVTARIDLGELSAEDVMVRVYYGPIDTEGGISEYQVAPMHASALRPASEEGRKGPGEPTFVGTLVCKSSGRLGYTVRVTPHHASLATTGVPGLSLWAS